MKLKYNNIFSVTDSTWKGLRMLRSKKCDAIFRIACQTELPINMLQLSDFGYK
jgi:hypothetical protein